MNSPMNWPTPVPKMASARPVTFWFARRVMVKKLKMRDANAPAKNANSSAITTARYGLGLATHFS